MMTNKFVYLQPKRRMFLTHFLDTSVNPWWNIWRIKDFLHGSKQLLTGKLISDLIVTKCLSDLEWPMAGASPSTLQHSWQTAILWRKTKLMLLITTLTANFSRKMVQKSLALFKNVISATAATNSQTCLISIKLRWAKFS